MGRIHKKTYIEQNVYEKALERIEYLYSVYDEVVVSFSGGKDSTAMLLCTIQVAKKLGRLPVRAIFFDEEAIHPPTIEYVERVRQMPEVKLEWYCLPMKMRNACSNEQPYWYCWDPKDKEIWVRDMPECAISDHPRFHFGMLMQDWGRAIYKNTNKVIIQGIRTEESIRRYRVVARKKEDNYLSTPEKGVFFAYPIYDWSSTDVWTLVKHLGADYNKTYDIYNQTDLCGHFLTQRVCPPYAEEPLRGLHMYAICFPEFWHKMINRVKGAATAARYGNTELYSQGFKPEETEWRDHIENILGSFSGTDRATVSDALNRAIKAHQRRTNDPIPESDPHPLTGCSWKFLSKMVTRGDFRGRVIQTMSQQGEKTRSKLGISLAEAESIYGLRTVRQQ